MVGLLLITHGRLGEALLETAEQMLGVCPLAAAALAVGRDEDPEALRRRARELVARLDQGAGVLVLTDIFGSTPANVASALQGPGVRVVAGLNLPMLIRVLNYPGLDLEGLAAKAESGGRDGVFLCGPGGC
ncbi:MAG: PTS fructose transporter subunit IIA [Gammaproteobacteria bacterium]|nr:MAG: PTS fructose transporter subunit IIA [Gammaproteobacteria bacterium]